MAQTITPKAVRERVTAAHMSLHKFLAQAGVTGTTFYRWERGDNEPYPLTLRKIADALEAIEAGGAAW